MPTYLQKEKSIIDLLKTAEEVIWKNQKHTIILVDKPIYGSGEGKTDIYCRLDNGEEIKISYKMKTADFLENKIKKERAQALFGNDWQQIIINAIMNIKDRFIAKPVYYDTKKGNVEAGSYTMGWRIDIVDKPARNKQSLTTELQLTQQQKLEILGGINLSEDKKNCVVGNTKIPNSGVANYILIEQDFKNAQDILNNLIDIADYNIPMYLSFRAVNYRSKTNAMDGNRSLGVYVKWMQNDYLLIFDHPLELGAKDVLAQFKKERMLDNK